MDLEFPKDHPLYGRRLLKLFSDEALLELYKCEDMVDAKFDLALFEELRAAKLEKDEQNLCLDSEQASEVKKPERKKPNSKEPTAKRAKVGKGKNVNESNAENEQQEACAVYHVFEEMIQLPAAKKICDEHNVDEKILTKVLENLKNSITQEALIQLEKSDKDGSAFPKCDESKKDVPVAPVDTHNCSLEAKIKDSHAVEQAAEVKKPERKKPNSKEPTAKRTKVGDQEGYDKEDKEGQFDDKEAPAPGEVEELTDEE